VGGWIDRLTAARRGCVPVWIHDKGGKVRYLVDLYLPRAKP